MTTVPPDAQQVLVFLAPRTGGDFGTLVDAVRGRPGAFVRASQDLNEAMLDRSRLEAYLSAIRGMDQADQDELKQAAPLLARSLAIKINDKCLDSIAQLQASCLTQGGESLILNDGHSTTIVEALTSGPASDLAMEASFTPQLSYGLYSPYIASLFDIGRIFASFRTAQYQYIPALGALQDDQLALTLNTPPSFHNPKSVMVAALPAVEPAQPPPLHAVDPKDIYCASRSALVLPVEGAPLVFSTAYTHDLVLHLVGSNGRSIDLPAHADAQQGGFVVDTSGEVKANLGAEGVRGSLRGYWGFDTYEGPSFQLVNATAQTWQVSAGDEAVVVGRQDTIHLRAASASCVQQVLLTDPAGKPLDAEWKAVKADEVELKLPLQAAQPGSLTLLVKQYGANAPQPVQLQAYSEPGHLDGFIMHAGDAQGVLTGSHLDEVASLLINGIEFLPAGLSTHQGSDALAMAAKDGQASAALKSGETLKAKVTLSDGRVLSVPVSVGLSRPSVTLIAKSVQPASAPTERSIQIVDSNELPQDAQLTFSVRARSPETFLREETIEVATADGASSATLSLSNGGITLANERVAIVSLDPARVFGMSGFGPLRFRVSVNGSSGDWQPLVTLVRVPVLKDLTCPSSPGLACKLAGTDLFLLESVASDAKFKHVVQVPDGFPGSALPVPQPTTEGRLYVKLRDDPSAVNPVTMTVLRLPPSPQDVARADSGSPAAAPAEPPSAAPGPSSESGASPANSPAVQPLPEQGAAAPPPPPP
jgi:hypothetical protein